MDLSVIIPAYNEEPYLRTTVNQVIVFLNNLNLRYEIILINDGSRDGTLREIIDLQKIYPSLITMIDNGVNLGKGKTIHTGMKQAKGTRVLFMDADHSVNIDNLTKFLNDEHPVVVGSIYIGKVMARDNNGVIRHLLRKFFHLLPYYVFKLNVQDTQRGFKLFRRDVVDLIVKKQTLSGFGFDIELLLIAHINNFPIKELGVQWCNPQKNTVRLIHYPKVFFEMVRIYINMKKGMYVSDAS